MKSQNPSTSLGEGRGNCPLPSRTHPQKLNLVVYTDELTHLCETRYQRNISSLRFGYHIPTIKKLVGY